MNRYAAVRTRPSAVALAGLLAVSGLGAAAQESAPAAHRDQYLYRKGSFSGVSMQ